MLALNQDPSRPATKARFANLRASELPKSASYTYLPAVKDSTYARAIPLPVRIRGDTSFEDLTTQLDSADVSPPDSSGCTTPHEDARPPVDVVAAASARLGSTRSASFEDSSCSSSEKRRSVEVDVENTTATPKSLAKRLGRRMSFIGSRSPSPTKADTKKRDTTIPNGVDGSSPRASRLLLRKDKTKTPDLVGSVPQEANKRRNTVTSNKETPNPPSRPPRRTFLPKSFSTDKLHAVVEISQDDAAPLPSPRLFNTERNSSALSLALPKRRDELWNIFRSLDGDFTKFSSKSTPFKANVIRQSLLPFLRNYAEHPSNYNLRAEDLDRRVVILNKWWAGLLELLHGRHNQSMSGTDRPTILDALSGVMERPEWRPAPSVFCPLARRHGDSHDGRKKSTTSLASVGSEFLTESVLHNVRNLFIQNLNAQLAFVVEKMSLRNASASLISFCGKALAWAFYFCPRVGDLLVREWTINAESMKRVLNVYGVGKFENLKAMSDETSSNFPPAVRSLAFTSLSKMVRSLREPAELPPMTAGLEMYGFWRDRWLGRESDLLYVFVKHYFILTNDYLPADLGKKQRIVSPGMLLVQAQILNNLDSTINRDVGSSQDVSGNPSPTFDDFLGGPDAVVSSMPMLPPNATRIMSENRLIMLIRDFLSDRVADHTAARHLFASTFCDLLSASARGTSSFNHAACYTLCDFLDEALIILTRYEQSLTCPGPVIDSAFWLDVFRKMLSSHNTVTEIRVFAFLYTSWNHLCSDRSRKEQLCLGLLLSDDLFDATFTHWCPMVRAYFMRLVCWRLGRYDGGSDELEMRILQKLFDRLRSMWSYHLFELEQAEVEGKALGTWAPCNPAPGRRFLIIRTDTQIAPGGAFLAFNGIIPPLPSNNFDRFGADSPIEQSSPATSPDSDLASEKEKETETGIRGFLRGIMGSNRNRSLSRDKKSAAQSKAGISPARAADDSANRPRDRQALTRAPPPVPPFRNYCFKFSLEFTPRPRGRNYQIPTSASLTPPPPRLIHPRLPLAAQKYLQELNLDPLVDQPEKPGSSVKLQYVGRALAEWNLIVSECQGFFDRRRAEGVPSDREVETPTLGVELFRRST
ncbi:hypothetical protein ANO11243_094870 [Dothideomycetidae sp. 11243]|nr:hypothetical protein ANO11243_094870 [fungal sp. No.11243]